MLCAELKRERTVIVVDCTIVLRIAAIGTMIVIAETGTGIGTDMAEATPDTIDPEMALAVTVTEIGIVIAIAPETEMIDPGTAGTTETTDARPTDVTIGPERLPRQGEATLLSPGVSVSTEASGMQHPHGLAATLTVCFKED